MLQIIYIMILYEWLINYRKGGKFKKKKQPTA